MKVFLVRHGETYANCEKKFAGWTDTQLTPKGIQQGKSASEKIDMTKIDVIITSDLSRAVDTATYIKKDVNLEITKLQAFREMHFGDWEDLTAGEMRKNDGAAVDAWWADYVNYKTPNGESLKGMYERVTEGYEKILNNHRGKNILLVSHSGVMRAILSKELCDSVEGYWKFRIENCAVIEIEYVDDFPVIKFR